MSKSEAFSPDYATARQRFRQAASRLGWQLEAHPIGVTGPGGEELTLEVGYSPSSDPDRVLVVSSGIHGVEGFWVDPGASACPEATFSPGWPVGGLPGRQRLIPVA